ncbi:MAG: response regulator transcription factor [Luteolibacter sp.]|uniref:response regulator transcription factor n=1 Tax=Luteolibacter sp. TaxID=1962973 RepID=UPI003267D960
MNARILLVEDEPGILQILSDLLCAEGHTVEAAADGHAGMRKVAGGNFDVLILDVMLPGMSGFEVCESARREGYEGGIIMLTALGRVPDRVKGLRTGADDYLVKPFDPDELLARVDALLRRTHKDEMTVTEIGFGNVIVDFSRATFSKNGISFGLASKESKILQLLINGQGKVISRDDILARIWPDQPFITPRTVDVHVAWLRQKIEDKAESPRHILTVRGEGYRFAK